MTVNISGPSPEDMNTSVYPEDIQKKILRKTQKQLQSLDIVDQAEQEELIARFINLGNALINNYLNQK